MPPATDEAPPGGCEYAGMTMVEVYTNVCVALGIKPNSRVIRDLNTSKGEESTTLDVSRNYIGEKGFKALLELIRLQTHLVRVVLIDNGITNDAVVGLCRVAESHPSLVSLDLSGNPLSLCGGQALLNLCRKNHRITELDVSRSNIEERMAKKITEALAVNTRLNSRTLPAVTPFQRAKRDHEAKRARRGEETKDDAESPETIAEYVAHHPVDVPKRCPIRGWAVLNVFIASSKTDFDSELHIIHTKVFPALNEALREKKVFLLPVSMHYDEAIFLRGHEKPKAAKLDTRCAEALDLVDSCRPIFTVLVGDKYGECALHIPDSERPVLKSIRNSELAPMGVLIGEYGVQGANTVPLVFFRDPTHHLSIPEALMELVTDNYKRQHPDPEGHVVVAEAGELKRVPGMVRPDPEVLERKYEILKEWKAHLLRDLPSTLVLSSYKAAFDRVTEKGQVLMKGLEGFEEEYQRRLLEVVNALYPDPPPETLSEVDSKEAEHHEFLTNVAVYGRKTIIGKAELYIVSPTSRNSLLLHGPRGCGMTGVMQSLIKKCMQTEAFHVAYHFVGHSGLSDDPHDMRTLLLSLCRQLPTGHRPPRSLLREVTLGPLLDYWKLAISQAASSLKGGRILLFIVDGIDRIRPPVRPPDVLVTGNTGKSLFGGPQCYDVCSWIPVCLPKNVRLVASCTSDTAVHQTLARRGQDSCEPVAVPLPGVPDMSVALQERLAARGITLSDQEVELLMSKTQSRSPRYIQLLTDRMVQRWEAGCPAYRQGLIRALPQTIQEMVDDILSVAENQCTTSLVKKAMGGLVALPDGMLEWQLREYLHDAVGQSYLPPSSRPLINGEMWGRLYYYIKPLLVALPYPGDKVINGMNRRLQLLPSDVRDAVVTRYFAMEEEVRKVKALVAKYLKAGSTANDRPLTVLSLKHFPGCMVDARMWPTLMASVFNIRFVQCVFKHSVAYAAFQEMLRAYTELHELTSGGTKGYGEHTKEDIEGWLHKMREYVHFVHHNLHSLFMKPSIAIQQGLTASSASNIYAESRQHFLSTKEAHIVWMNKDCRRSTRGGVNSVCYSRNGLRTLQGMEDKEVQISNVVGDALHSITTTAPVLEAKFSPTSRYAVAVLEDKTIGVYDAVTGSTVVKITGMASAVQSFDVSARGRYVIVGSEDKSVSVMESESGRTWVNISHAAHNLSSSPFSKVSVCAAHPSDESIFLSGIDRLALVWQITGKNKYTLLHSLTAHTSWPLSTAAWCQEGAFIVTCCRQPEGTKAVVPSQDTPIKIWQGTTGALVGKLFGCDEAAVAVMAISPCENLIAAGLPGEVKLWSIHWGELCDSTAVKEVRPLVCTKLLQYLPTMAFPAYQHVTHLAFWHDSSKIVAAGDKYELKILNLLDGMCLAEFVFYSDVLTLACSTIPAEDGSQIIAGDTSGHTYFLRFVSYNM